MSADPESLSDMPACKVQLYDMHAGFIYSDTHVCKVLLYQARNLVCLNTNPCPNLSDLTLCLLVCMHMHVFVKVARMFC